MKVELVDSMGTDLTAANAARVSFDKHKEEFDEKDAKLIHYLSEHNHWTPFAHIVVTMRETVPIFVARQRFKHTVGFTYNEVSRRYVSDDPEFFHPKEWRSKPENKKQGSGKNIINFLLMIKDQGIDDNGTYYEDWEYEEVDRAYTKFINSAKELYNLMLDSGIAPEQARILLPQSMYTSYYVTGSLAAWARAYNLRNKEDAQEEIRDLSIMWDNILKDKFPVSWKELTNGR